MNNTTFFKLPLILVVSYWLMGCAYSICMAIIKSPEYIGLFEYIMNIIFNSLFYGLPKLLLLMFMSSLALYRCYVHEVTFKNILCLTIIALIIVVIMQLLYQFIGSTILGYFFENFYYDQYIAFFAYQIIMNVISYLIISLITYYGILSLQNVFDYDLNTKLITQNNSAKIHLGLFLLLFMFIYMLFLIPSLSYAVYSYSYDYQYFITIFYLISIIIVALILYFLLKSCFNCAFATLQTSRIVKSSILSFVLSGIVNAIISVGMIFIVIIIAFGSYYGNDSKIVLVVLAGVALQLLLTCLIIRAVTRRYFSVTFNESAL